MVKQAATSTFFKSLAGLWSGLRGSEKVPAALQFGAAWTWREVGAPRQPEYLVRKAKGLKGTDLLKKEDSYSAPWNETFGLQQMNLSASQKRLLG
ncbi:hypothetical protein AV530_013367 [Patagioenas fasciata monilis]|uniref:Uncharacterized protein n=1 Tax=Patagioenas fasciata monilis TaxID=372326 RepID=A0A1V4JP59_PATFA|nr:hypothetical protein AV530_013367 [Patagioenas fasciata monilis]